MKHRYCNQSHVLKRLQIGQLKHLILTKVIETCSLAEILPIVRDYNPFLLVVDEHGGTEGLITAADLTGEIVGEEMLNSRVYSDMKMFHPLLLGGPFKRKKHKIRRISKIVEIV